MNNVNNVNLLEKINWLIRQMNGLTNQKEMFAFYGPKFTTSGSIFIGEEAGSRLATGTNNTFLGEQTGKGMTSGDHNVFIGGNTNNGTTSGSGDENTIVGANALITGTTTASRNTGIGYGVFENLTSEVDNIAIGHSVHETASGLDNTVTIGLDVEPEEANSIKIASTTAYEVLRLQDYKVDLTQTLGAGQDGWVLAYNHAAGQVQFQAP